MSDLQNRGVRDARATTAFAAICFVFALAVRLLHYQQSLWCDEMAALLGYIDAPWLKIVAPGPGEYVPNDHVLFTLLAKLCLQLDGGSSREHSPATVAALIRLPSLIAGALTPFALAWPMRRTPMLALLVALFTAVNPWLVAFTDEARGYSLMILLGVVATNLLPDGSRRWPVAYGIAVAAAVYAVQVAGAVLLAHFVYVVIFRRSALGAWMRGTLVAAGISIVLLLPMIKGIWYYYQHPLLTSAELGDFANQLPRFAFAGQYIPSDIDPLIHIPDFSQGLWCWCVPVLMLITGCRCARGERELRQPMAVMAIATLLFFPLAIISVKVVQVRFDPWCGVWLVLSVAAIAEWVRRHWGSGAMLAMVVISAAWFVYRDVALLPSQPVREAMLLADDEAPPKVQIVMALLTADESARIYGGQCVRQHELVVAASPPTFARAERSAMEKTGGRPWVILSYEYMPRDFSPGFWDYFQAHYQLQARLPGRISPVTIYRPR